MKTLNRLLPKEQSDLGLHCVINQTKIDRSLFLKLRKRLAGCVPMPRDSSESDLVDSVFYRVYGFLQTPNAL